MHIDWSHMVFNGTPCNMYKSHISTSFAHTSVKNAPLRPEVPSSFCVQPMKFIRWCCCVVFELCVVCGVMFQFFATKWEWQRSTNDPVPIRTVLVNQWERERFPSLELSSYHAMIRIDYCNNTDTVIHFRSNYIQCSFSDKLIFQFHLTKSILKDEYCRIRFRKSYWFDSLMVWGQGHSRCHSRRSRIQNNPLCCSLSRGWDHYRLCRNISAA